MEDKTLPKTEEDMVRKPAELLREHIKNSKKKIRHVCWDMPILNKDFKEKIESEYYDKEDEE